MKKQMKYFGRFIIEHRFLCGMFVFSIWIILKNSNIPYGCLENIKIIHILFDKFPAGFLRELSSFVEVFLSAYATGLMFYYIVDYIPQQEVREKALKTLQPRIEKIYENMTMFYMMYKTVAEKQGVWNEDAKLDEMRFDNERVYCRKVVSYENKEYKYFYEFIKDANKCIKEIQKRAERICELSYFLYLGEEEKNAISILPDIDIFTLFPKEERNAISGIDYGQRLRAFEECRKCIGSLLECEKSFYLELMEQVEEEKYKNEINAKRIQTNTVGRNDIMIIANGNRY